jgi:hypothetical protein
MTNVRKGDPLHSAVAALQVGLERQSLVLASLEARIAHLHEDVRRVGEMTTRIKLAADNAKDLAKSHQDVLTALEKRLEAVEPLLEKPAKP